MAKKQRKERNRTQHIEIYKRRGTDTRLEELLEVLRGNNGRKQKKKERERETKEKRKASVRKSYSTAREGSSKGKHNDTHNASNAHNISQNNRTNDEDP